jgi:asparagine synthase (glutamine-hydrolysing)
MATTSVFAQRCLFRCAQEAGIKVMLDGQGADEIMGGYHSLVAVRLSSMINKFDWLSAFRFFRLGTSSMGNYRLRLLLTATGRLLPKFFQKTLRYAVDEGPTPYWLNKKWFASRGVILECRYPPVGKNMFREEASAFIEHLSLPQLLRWEDRNSMSSSVESRVPFLTPEIVQFTLSLPDNYLIDQDGCTKAVFRKAMRGIVPDKILDRKDKIGFATPENKWMAELRPMTEKALTLNIADGNVFPFLNLSSCKKDELKLLTSGKGRYTSVAWRILNTILWLNNNNLKL